jgi:hypothetical protein
MELSIPLFSAPLLFAAFLALAGLAVYIWHPRLSVIGIGAGAAIAAIIAIIDIPNAFTPQGIFLFGMTVLVGGWMVAVGMKKPKNGN